MINQLIFINTCKEKVLPNIITDIFEKLIIELFHMIVSRIPNVDSLFSNGIITWILFFLLLLFLILFKKIGVMNRELFKKESSGDWNKKSEKQQVVNSDAIISKSGWYIETVEQKSEFYTFKNPCKKYRDWNPFDYI